MGMKKPGHIWLLGLSGSGKSTLGPILANLLHLPFFDTDEIIIQNAQHSIPEIFSSEGENGFRKRETQVIRDLEKQNAAVVACGGGAVLVPSNRECMRKAGTRVYLRVPLQTLSNRLESKKDRPLLAHGPILATLTEQLAAREPWYRDSEIEINADAPSVDVAREVFQRLMTQA
jgi:shikimate kinase